MPGSKPEDIQTVRFPFAAESLARLSDELKDQKFLNGYFDILSNSATGKKNFFFAKRAGLSQNIRPAGTNAVGRGFINWKNNIYSCFGNQLYKNGTNLGVTLTTSSGKASFESLRPGAVSPYGLAFTDGITYLSINEAGNVIVHNNVVVTSSSVGNPSTITTATPHNLATGNQVILRNHTGSTPAISNTVYTVTVTSPTSFTIPVNVTVAGTGGTIGWFPGPLIPQLVYFDGYIVATDIAGNIWNTDLDSTSVWDPTKFITPIMENGTAIGITRQANFLIWFSTRHTQAFYNAANPTGSPFTNYEQGEIQIGCIASSSIVNEEAFVTFIGASETGGFSVIKLQGLGQPKVISDPVIERILNAEKEAIKNAIGNLLRSNGHFFYVLRLVGSDRTLIYDYDIEMWYEWTGTSGTTGWPIVDVLQQNQKPLVQHETNGWIYNLDPAVGQDDLVNFPVTATFSRIDLDTNSRKFVHSAELIGDIQSSSTPVSLSYSDNDYISFSTPRILDMQYPRMLAKNLGNFRRRAWRVSYTGPNPFRLEALQLKFRLGGD